MDELGELVHLGQQACRGGGRRGAGDKGKCWKDGKKVRRGVSVRQTHRSLLATKSSSRLPARPTTCRLPNSHKQTKQPGSPADGQQATAALTAVHQLCHPVRRRLLLCQVELDLQHSVREASDLGAVDGQAGVAVPPAVQRQYSQGRNCVGNDAGKIITICSAAVLSSSSSGRGGRRSRPALSAVLGTAGSVRECESAGVGACLPALAVVGPSSGFSFIMHRLVSRLRYMWAVHMGQYRQQYRSNAALRLFCCGRSAQPAKHPAGCAGFALPTAAQAQPRCQAHLMRTVGSKGIWKAVRWYCVRIMGLSCLESTTRCTSVNRAEVAAMASSAALPCRQAGRQEWGQRAGRLRGQAGARGQAGPRGQGPGARGHRGGCAESEGVQYFAYRCSTACNAAVLCTTLQRRAQHAQQGWAHVPGVGSCAASRISCWIREHSTAQHSAACTAQQPHSPPAASLAGWPPRAGPHPGTSAPAPPSEETDPSRSRHPAAGGQQGRRLMAGLL